MKKNALDKILKSRYFGIGTVAVAVIAAVIILFSGNSESNTSKPEYFNEFEYTDLLEEKINKIVSKIEGAGKSYTMVSLENSYEKIYAKDIDQSYEENGENSLSKNEEYSDKVVIYDSGDEESALQITEISPKISGVIIVCEGGDSEHIKKSVSQAVSTLLNISSDKICVLKSK